ncbi:Syntaxin-16 [Frankliniella fusca]|uniref:Syntaxin-16 n=1 Tax=Frankliniella fusca TaxID=407009 RepID=A0AAE1H4B4_9NEOP|nr:Syntaxin-16 [Frankliniella fusca]
MATRSLTEVFVLMRNNAMQSRHIYTEQAVSDRMALVPRSVDVDIELADSRLPPTWSDGLEEAQYALSRIRGKLRQLAALHTRHLQRPTLDDTRNEEIQIEALSQEIMRMFNSCHKMIQQIRHDGMNGSGKERQLAKSVVSALANSLQELSNNFKTSQGDYLRKLDSREERSRQYFENPWDVPNSASAQSNAAFLGLDDRWEVDSNIDNIDQQFSNAASGRMTQTQLLLMEEENTKLIAEREKEVSHIVQSIGELNAIFKDLAHMVADQGTILDRIDYNVEQTQIQVGQGYQQLQKADSYQRKNRKMVCILVLAAAIILMLFLLIIFKL